jgi:hypothetical protein
VIDEAGLCGTYLGAFGAAAIMLALGGTLSARREVISSVQRCLRAYASYVQAAMNACSGRGAEGCYGPFLTGSMARCYSSATEWEEIYREPRRPGVTLQLLCRSIA